MASTVKRITLALSKEDLKQLNKLCEEYGETPSEVLKRALTYFYFKTFDD